MRSQYDVIISGGGPVGLALAIDLGQRGVRVAVFEKNPEPPGIPKGQNLTQRTMEHLTRWGVEAEIRAAKTIPKGVGIGGLTAYGSLFSGHHYDWYKRAVVAPYYYAENERLPQYATEAVLRKRVGRIDGVDFFPGWTIETISQTDSGVGVSASDGHNFKVSRAKYLVGCDGSRSTVRTLAGFSETVQDHEKSMVLIVFESEEFFDLLQRFADKQFYNVLHPDLDGYWMFFGLVEWGKSFFFHAPVPASTNRENFDFEEFICRAVGRKFAMHLSHVGFWDLRISHVDQYQKGRIFVAGDAAHSHPPYGGFGINTGFEDARNLGWKIAAVLNGWGGPDLLPSYHGERAPVFRSTARDFIDRFITDDRDFLHKYSPENDRVAFDAAWKKRADGGSSRGIDTYAPHYGDSAIITGGDRAAASAVGRHEFSVRPGRHFPPQPLDDGTTTADMLSDGFTLFHSGTGAECAAVFAAAGEITGVPLSVVKITENTTDVYGQTCILVRPDDFVAWAGNDCSNLVGLLLRSAGREEPLLQ